MLRMVQGRSVTNRKYKADLRTPMQGNTSDDRKVIGNWPAL